MTQKLFRTSLLASFSFTLALGASCTVGDGTVDIDPGSGAASKFVKVSNPIAGRYIVVLNAPKDRTARSLVNVASITSLLANNFRAKVDKTWSDAFHGFTAKMSEADAIALSADPRVAFVEQDGIVRLSANQSGATWGLDRIDQASLPLNGNYSTANDGAGVTAYIVDTGINPAHNDFGGRVTSGFTAINC
jgi:aqualysin 1